MAETIVLIIPLGVHTLENTQTHTEERTHTHTHTHTPLLTLSKHMPMSQDVAGQCGVRFQRGHGAVTF